MGHLGIRTPDNVIFAGDSLIAPEILSENPFLYLADPEQQLTTLANFPGDDEPLLYLSHGGRQDNISAVISTNYQLFFSIVDTIKNILAKPLPLEDIIREIIRRQGLDINRNHYYRLRASVSAFLAYLCNHRQTQAYSGNQGDVLFKLIK